MIGSKLSNLRTTDIITLAYMLVTALFILIFGGFSAQFAIPILVRFVLIGFIIFILYLSKSRDNNYIYFIHLFYPILMLTYFYGETDLLNNLVFSDNLDPYLFKWEESIFGFQPSLEFSITFPQKWFSELLHFGYFSYYIMTFTVCLVFFLKQKLRAEKIIFTVISSFFIYYLIFIIFPLVGPQFHFQTPLSDVADSGIFSRAVKLVQYYGEKPTGAFPSSHVGMALIFLYLSFKNIRWLFWFIVPLFILIMLATVYLKAHYAIDVIAGILSAPLVYLMSSLLFKFISRKSYLPA